MMTLLLMHHDSPDAVSILNTVAAICGAPVGALIAVLIFVWTGELKLAGTDASTKALCEHGPREIEEKKLDGEGRSVSSRKTRLSGSIDQCSGEQYARE